MHITWVHFCFEVPITARIMGNTMLISPTEADCEILLNTDNLLRWLLSLVDSGTIKELPMLKMVLPMDKYRLYATTIHTICITPLGTVAGKVYSRMPATSSTGAEMSRYGRALPAAV